MRVSAGGLRRALAVAAALVVLAVGAPALAAVTSVGPSPWSAGPVAAPAGSVTAVPTKRPPRKAPFVAVAPSAAPGRAAWVWFPDDPAQIVADAGRRGVDELFVHVTPGLRAPGERSRLADLHARASAAGITLQALGGDPAWTTDHRAALRWQRAALATGWFTGSHVDVEPWGTAEWQRPGHRTQMVGDWLRVLAKLQRDSALPLEVDVTYNCHQIAAPGHGTMASRVLAIADAVTVMSYRDTAAQVLATGSTMIALGESAGTPVRLSVDTRPSATEPHTTFSEEGAAALDTALDAVDAAVTSPVYRGMAVHDEQGWTWLEERTG